MPGGVHRSCTSHFILLSQYCFFEGENKNVLLPNYQLQLSVTENIFVTITLLQLTFNSLIAYGIFLLCNFTLYNVTLTT